MSSFSTIVAASVLLLSASANAREFQATYSGVAGCCSEDLNEDGTLGARGSFSGKSTLGKIEHAYQLSDLDTTALLPPTAECNAGADARLLVFAASAVVMHSDGSALYKTMATDGRESFICIDFDGDDFSSIFSWVIVGGTGRFEGASGESTSRGREFFRLPGQTSITFDESGTVNVPQTP